MTRHDLLPETGPYTLSLELLGGCLTACLTVTVEAELLKVLALGKLD